MKLVFPILSYEREAYCKKILNPLNYLLIIPELLNLHQKAILFCSYVIITVTLKLVTT